MTLSELEAVIVSERLDLVLMSNNFMLASLSASIAEAEALLGARLPRSWPDNYARAVIERRLRQIAAAPGDAPWLLRAMVRREDGRVVGCVNFHGPPNEEGQAELGYTVFEDERRQGYATEAILAMMLRAREVRGVRRFLLSISPANEASLRLAAKLGFQRIGSQIDEIDGEEQVFELVQP